jgi:hypothetical protein
MNILEGDNQTLTYSLAFDLGLLRVLVQATARSALISS